MFCREAAARFAPRKAEIEKAGAKMLFIGNGKAEHAKWFVENLALGDLPVYTDPRRASFREAGLKAGVARVASPKALLNAARALKAGFRQSRTKGNPWQMGGVVLIDAKGKTRWTHIEENAGEIADPDGVLAEVKKL